MRERDADRDDADVEAILGFVGRESGAGLHRVALVDLNPSSAAMARLLKKMAAKYKEEKERADEYSRRAMTVFVELMPYAQGYESPAETARRLGEMAYPLGKPGPEWSQKP